MSAILWDTEKVLQKCIWGKNLKKLTLPPKSIIVALDYAIFIYILGTLKQIF